MRVRILRISYEITVVAGAGFEPTTSGQGRKPAPGYFTPRVALEKPRGLEEVAHRTAKFTGLGKLPSQLQHVNAAWLELALTAADLLAWAQTGLLADEPDLARAEPRLLRYRLLHTAARLTRGQRRLWLRLAKHWPWARPLARAFQTLRRIPLVT